jgi:hypothetical protein
MITQKKPATTTMMKFPVLAVTVAFAFLAVGTTVEAFSVLPGGTFTSKRTPLVLLDPLAGGSSPAQRRSAARRSTTLFFARPAPAETEYSFIDTELRGAAMRLHTREQAPREGAAPAVVQPPQPYTPTRDDYLAFLVDSHHVYSVMEDIVNDHHADELAMFRNTGLERTGALERDIQYLCETYSLRRPDVGLAGRRYADLLLRTMPSSGATTTTTKKNIPAFICHYYNHYFAHTAGGRMIGKKMSNLLLDGTVLQFYQVRTTSCERRGESNGSARSVYPHYGSTSCYCCYYYFV